MMCLNERPVFNIPLFILLPVLATVVTLSPNIFAVNDGKLLIVLPIVLTICSIICLGLFRYGRRIIRDLGGLNALNSESSDRPRTSVCVIVDVGNRITTKMKITALFLCNKDVTQNGSIILF